MVVRGIARRAAGWALLLAGATGCSEGAAPPPSDPAGAVSTLLEIRDLAIVPNPRSTLTCFVRWKTNYPATSTVEFGKTVPYEWRTGEPGLATEHEVLVLGMHALTEYHLCAVSRAGRGQVARSGDRTFRAGPLPESIRVGKVTRHVPGAALEGWTLMNVTDSARRTPPTALMVDMDGQVVWYEQHGTSDNVRYGMHVSLVDGDEVLCGQSGPPNAPRRVDLAGRLLWEGPPPTPTASLHHHFELLPNGHYVTLRDIAVGGIVGDRIEELRPTHEVVWSWDTFDRLVPTVSQGDWTHANSVTVDLDRQAVYLNARNLDQLIRIDRSTGAIVWRLGRGGDFAPDPAAEHPWFRLAHDPEIQPDGNLLIYDNGDDDRGFSRVVEYRLDEVARTATIVWEYAGGGTDPWFTPIWGDADRLANGNTLITAGTPRRGDVSRVFEVSPAGEIVWELTLPSTEESVRGAYRAERIAPPKLTRLD